MNLIDKIKWFASKISLLIKSDSEHKRFMIRTGMNYLMARIGKNNQYNYTEIKMLFDSDELIKEPNSRSVPMNKILPFDITHNLVCPKCKVKFFDLVGKSTLVDIRKSMCPFCSHNFNGLDRSYWCTESENLDEHITGIEGIKKRMVIEGWVPPPVELYYDDKTELYYKIGDGFKRMISHIELGKESVLAFVFHKKSINSTPSSPS